MAPETTLDPKLVQAQKDQVVADKRRAGAFRQFLKVLSSIPEDVDFGHSFTEERQKEVLAPLASEFYKWCCENGIEAKDLLYMPRMYKTVFENTIERVDNFHSLATPIIIRSLFGADNFDEGITMHRVFELLQEANVKLDAVEGKVENQ
jgi:hypothetical protein